jgi:hypothetical protein
MDALTFIRRMCTLMEINPPAPADADMLERFSAFGITPGRFGLETGDPFTRKSVEQGMLAGKKRLSVHAHTPPGRRINGWRMSPANAASYGSDYIARAVDAFHGWTAGLPEDVVSFTASETVDGQPLSGAHRYVLRFPKGESPPVKGFWSVTMYDRRQRFVPNAIGRYSLNTRDRLRLDRDGGLSLIIQQSTPAPEQQSNWLPAPPDAFSLIMRLYWPKTEALEARWKMPRIEMLQ